MSFRDLQSSLGRRTLMRSAFLLAVPAAMLAAVSCSSPSVTTGAASATGSGGSGGGPVYPAPDAGTGGDPAPDRPAPPKPPPPHPINEWVLQTSPDTTPRFGWEAAGAFDPYTHTWIHQGGHDGIPQGFALFAWDFEGKTWEQRFAPNSPAGVCIVDGAGAFDEANRRFVRFPGASLGHGYQWSRGVSLKSSAAWLYDTVGNTWSAMRPTLPYPKGLGAYSVERLATNNAAVTYDPRHEVLLNMGGITAGGGSNSLWVYDAYDNRLEHLKAENPPAPRDGHALAYSARNSLLITFGGQYLSDEATYVYDYKSSAWQSLTTDPHPPGLKGATYSTIPKMACNPTGDECLLVAWDEVTSLVSTWIFDSAARTWKAMTPKVSPDPSKSRTRNISYVSEYNLFILETWTVDGVPQIWTYRYEDKPAGTTLGAPTDLAVTVTADKAHLQWTPSYSPGTTYRVYRAELGDPWTATPAAIADTAKTEIDDAVAAGKSYLYKVTAVAGAAESAQSISARTQPRAALQPVVSVISAKQVDIAWAAHPAKDVIGYNVCRSPAVIRTTTQGKEAPWADNDPVYTEPHVVEVQDFVGYTKINPALVTEPSYSDTLVDLTVKGPEASDYKLEVYAYVVRAVNALGVESGPSPYALTIPSEPQGFLLQESGNDAMLKWSPSAEKKIAGYRLYRMGSGVFSIVALTPENLIDTTSLTQPTDGATTRFWVTAVDALGQEGQPSSPVWFKQSYKGFYKGDWHQ
jgi:hypothetical protein